MLDYIDLEVAASIPKDLKVQKRRIFKYKLVGHIDELDGVRGFAIILVLINHFLKFAPFSSLSNFSWVGVDLFFVLSGFLITGILLNNKKKRYYFRNFYMRRVLRIFPLYYLVLIVLFFLLPKLIELPDEFGYFISRKEFYFFYLQNNLFIIDGWPESELLSHFWSLAIEEQFYIFWPFVVFLLKERNIIFTSVLIIIISVIIRLIYSNELLTYFSSFTRFDGLCLGSIAAVLIRVAPNILSVSAPYFFCGSTSLICYWLIKTDFQTGINNYYFMRWGYTVIDLFWVSVIIFSLSANKYIQFVSAFFRLGTLRFFGKISYGIYMYHMLLFGFLAPIVAKILVSSGYSVNGTFNLPVAIIITLLTVLLSYFSYQYFEAPLLKLKKRFT